MHTSHTYVNRCVNSETLTSEQNCISYPQLQTTPTYFGWDAAEESNMQCQLTQGGPTVLGETKLKTFQG